MTPDKKSQIYEDLIERIAQRLFDSYAKDWAGDHDARLWDEIDEEEAREWREEAIELLTPAYEQGKLEEGKRIVQIARKHVDKTNLRSFGYLSADELVDWLKSQIKEGEKR